MNSRAWMITILVALFVVGIALSMADAYLTPNGSRSWWQALLNLGPELIGAVVTYTLFEVFIGRRQEAEEEKTRLIQELGSSVHDVAIAAAEKVRRLGWLTSDELIGARLEDADLRNADLSGFHLSRASLVGADLRGANLRGAVLIGAWLCSAKIQGAWLEAADLRNAKIWAAELQGANLSWACLERAELTHTSGNASFDETTILPDQVRWTPDTDIARFTDSEQPDFWRSDNCPHYWGNEE